MARLILALKPLISPSTFLLGTDGSAAARGPAEEIAAARFSGLDPASQFAPLSEEARRSNPELAGRFDRRYREYRKRVVVPLFDHLRGCHRLAVLIDLPGLLSANTGMFDDNLKMLKELLFALKPGASFLARALRGLLSPVPLAWRPGGITRMSFIAAKSDLVHPADRDALTALLKSMTGRLALDHDRVKHQFAALSALVSTEPAPGRGKRLIGRPVYDENGEMIPPQSGIREFPVSEPPTEWPAAWSEGDFNFVKVYPAMPRRRNLPPPQLGLAQVAGFLLAP